jgi:guanine deaminase
MNLDTSLLRPWMALAVDASTRHVEAGGLPFVGVLVTEDGLVSDLGVNLVLESGDPCAHAEIVAMRQVLQHRGRTSLQGTVLLATGEPCALCYRFASAHRVAAVRYAVDRDTAAEWGFDYRAGYDAIGATRLPVAQTARRIPVDRGLEPFARYAELHGLVNTDQS